MRIFKSRLILEQLTLDEIHALEIDLNNYKNGNGLPDIFGRDEYYDHPNTIPIIKMEKVRHIHLASSDNPWSNHKMQYNKTSDSHLVYCQGAINDDCYLLMAILSPDAHNKAKDNNWMHKLGRMAERFRFQF